MHIHPSLQQLHIKLGRSISSKFLGNYVTKFKGDGLEFADVREYIAGDPINRIDRKTSAKKGGDLHTKEFVEERQLKIRFLDDCASGSKQYIVEQAMYALGFAAIRNGDRIGLIDGKQTVQLGGKWETLYRILHSIQNKEQSAKKFLHTIRYVLIGGSNNTLSNKSNNLADKLRQIIQMKKHGSLVVIITDTIDVDHKLIKKIGEKNEILWLHIFNPEELTLESEQAYIQFGDKRGSMMVKSHNTYQKNERVKAYQDTIQKRLDEIKRLIQGAGGRYIVMSTTDDAVRELMRVMEG